MSAWTPARFYVASRASVPERAAMWRRLRAEGAPIISTWIDEAGEGETADFGELWQRVEREIKSATALIFYAKPDDLPLKGALVEVGMALASRVPVYVVVPDIKMCPRTNRPIGSWISHWLVRRFDTVEQAIQAAEARGDAP